MCAGLVFPGGGYGIPESLSIGFARDLRILEYTAAEVLQLGKPSSVLSGLSDGSSTRSKTEAKILTPTILQPDSNFKF